jgi:hypothetical protein
MSLGDVWAKAAKSVRNIPTTDKQIFFIDLILK